MEFFRIKISLLSGLRNGYAFPSCRYASEESNELGSAAGRTRTDEGATGASGVRPNADWSLHRLSVLLKVFGPQGSAWRRGNAKRTMRAGAARSGSAPPTSALVANPTTMYRASLAARYGAEMGSGGPQHHGVRASARPRLPRTCPIRASGSSGYGLALPEHELVDRDALVGKGVDACLLAGEDGIEPVPGASRRASATVESAAGSPAKSSDCPSPGSQGPCSRLDGRLLRPRSISGPTLRSRVHLLIESSIGGWGTFASHL